MKKRLDSTFEKIHRSVRSNHTSQRESWHEIQQSELYQQQVGFRCMHCRQRVSSQMLYSAVNNRNHCPYCLWSRHVDLLQAGDRLSACRQGLRPIGLTFKRQRNKYGSALGELMLIHQCSGCSAFSINRIAADDDREGILQLLEISDALPEGQHERMRTAGIIPADMNLRELVITRLYGKGHGN